MADEITDDFTIILNSAAKGDQDAAERAWCMVYGHLHSVARKTLGTPMLGERQVPGPTTVVRDAFLEVCRMPNGDEGDAWKGRKEFFLAIAKRMVRSLIEHRRRNPNLLRGGFSRMLPLQTNFNAIAEFDTALKATDAGIFESLEGLEKDHPKASEVVWLRYVCGLTIEQSSQLLDMKPRTVCKQWNYARAWIRRDLERTLRRELPEAG